MPTTPTFAAIVTKLYDQLRTERPLELTQPESLLLTQYADPDCAGLLGESVPPETRKMLAVLIDRHDFTRPLEAAQAVMAKFPQLAYKELEIPDGPFLAAQTLMARIDSIVHEIRAATDVAAREFLTVEQLTRERLGAFAYGRVYEMLKYVSPDTHTEAEAETKVRAAEQILKDAADLDA